jgi:VIT1/CCC1 family predicted Fe2+/Mn2+ transporter
VFGISDGLVSNTSLVLGIAGASAASGLVRLAGLAGLLGGAFSMAAGEYISMRAQSELFQREIEIERREIERHPKGELRELVHLYESRGIPSELAQQLAREMMADPEVALETHAREELGIDPSSTGKPLQAAFWSFFTFAVDRPRYFGRSWQQGCRLSWWAGSSLSSPVATGGSRHCASS